MDRELEAILRQFEDLRRVLPPESLAGFDELMARTVEIKDPADRQRILDAIIDPEGVLSREDKDRILAEAAMDELLPRRLHRRAMGRRRSRGHGHLS